MGKDIHLSKANKLLDVAEKILEETYPVVKEPKLVLAVAEDIYSALVNGIDALITGPNRGAHDEFESRFAAFQEIASKHGFSKEDLDLVLEIHNIIVGHEESPVEFSRKDRFVICDSGYNCSEISYENMQKYLFRARLFVKKVSSALTGKESSRGVQVIK
jgi:hypothetical protein